MPAIKFKNLKLFLRGQLPKQVILEYTDQCNASCAQCSMRRENRYQRSTLNLEALKPAIDKMVEQHVDYLMLTGGEPLLYLSEIAECSRYARNAGIDHVITGTNGFMFKRHNKASFNEHIKTMTNTLLESGVNSFWISLDSARSAVHEKNRGLAGSVEGMAKALPIMHEQGLYPTVGLVLNREMGKEALPSSHDFEPKTFYQACRQSLRDYYQTVLDLGFSYMNVSYPIDWDSDRDDVVYRLSSTENLIHFSRAEKALLYRALFDSILEFRHKLRIVTPLVSLRSLIRYYENRDNDAYGCLGGINIFFIDSKEMNSYPCGFRGQENLGKFHEIDFKQLDRSASCKACDLQCFRDPSELMSPFIDMRHRPWHLAKRCWQDRDYARLWLDGMRYISACNYFDGCAAPNPKALAQFKTVPPFAARAL